MSRRRGGQSVRMTSGSPRHDERVVQAPEHFPAPEDGVIRLEEDTLYWVVGTISIGDSRIEMANGSALMGRYPERDGLVTDNPSALITLADGRARVARLTLVNTSGDTHQAGDGLTLEQVEYD